VDVPVRNLIFIDESGANLQMAPRYGRGYQGKRIVFGAPFNKGNKITMIGAISFERVETALYSEGSANGELFLKFIKECLCPLLQPRHVVVMDNVAFHKVKGINEAITAIGAKLIYLPPYSPDLNPIEMMWSKIKCFLRKMATRTFDDFNRAIKNAFKNIVQTDLQGWFKHSGYVDQHFWEPL
jgi:transposase